MAPAPETKNDRVSPVEIPAAPRFEVGSLAWIPSERVQAEDMLVTTAFHFIAIPGTLAPDKARELGRALGRAATKAHADEVLRAFSHLGLGAIESRESESGRYVFVGREMLVDAIPNPPACAVALGFVEGYVHAITGHPALGTEITCRGRGQAECRYLVMEKR